MGYGIGGGWGGAGGCLGGSEVASFFDIPEDPISTLLCAISRWDAFVWPRFELLLNWLERFWLCPDAKPKKLTVVKRHAAATIFGFILGASLVGRSALLLVYHLSNSDIAALGMLDAHTA